MRYLECSKRYPKECSKSRSRTHGRTHPRACFNLCYSEALKRYSGITVML
nr:MAG TPA: hypothetical protein [Caudoviricetes sp.]